MCKNLTAMFSKSLSVRFKMFNSIPKSPCKIKTKGIYCGEVSRKVTRIVRLRMNSYSKLVLC